MTAGRPIRPDEVGEEQVRTIPAAVFHAFNRLIAKHWDGHSARIGQGTAVAAIVGELGIDQKAVFEEHYLDVEEAYRSAGWQVDYDRPGYNEAYEATFVFTKGSK